MEEKLPKTLYKYTSAKTAFNILSTSQIRFSSPETFNDPFEVSPPVKIIGFSRESKEILSKTNFMKSYHGIVETFISYLKLFCLSGTKDSILMWSHYADMHKGVVIGFDTSKDIINKCKKVTYEMGTINIDKTIENRKKLKNNIPTSDINNLDNEQYQKALYYHKHRDWNYEQEYRCSYPFSEKEYQDAIQKKEQTKYAFIQISEDSINSVYLGCKISEEDKLAILNIMSLKYPNIKCYQAQKSKDFYELDFIETKKP